MYKKVYWGLGITLIVIVITGIFIFIHQWKDIQQLKRDDVISKKLREENKVSHEKPFVLRQNADTETVKPIQKLEDVNVDWPATENWPINWKALYNLPDAEYAKLPQATRDAVKRAYYADMGLTPPPKGFQHYLNPNTGTWDLVPNNVPIIKVKEGMEQYNQTHQLNDSEYERYIALDRIKSNQESVENYISSGQHPNQILRYPPEVTEIANEWYQELHEKTYGPTFVATFSVYYDRPRTHADEVNVRQLMDEAIKNAIPKRQRSIRDTDVVVEEILDEIEVVLGITIERETEATKISKQFEDKVFGNLQVPE